MHVETIEDLGRLNVCFLFMDALYLFRDEQVSGSAYIWLDLPYLLFAHIRLPTLGS